MLRSPSHLFPGRSHRAALWLRACLLLLLLACGSARAQEALVPVQLRVAGREFVGKTPALSNGTETYVPLEVLAVVGAESKPNAKGDSLLVTVKAAKRQAELALARPKGKPMLALSDLERLLDAVVVRPEAAEGKPGDTVYLLARVKEVQFDNGVLRVLTSFPVPYQVRTLKGVEPPRSYVDCLGAAVAEDLQPAPLPKAETRALLLRTGQNTPEVARIVLEHMPGLALKVGETAENASVRITAALTTEVTGKVARAETGKPGAGVRRDREKAKPIRVAEADVQQPAALDSGTPAIKRPGGQNSSAKPTPQDDKTDRSAKPGAQARTSDSENALPFLDPQGRNPGEPNNVSSTESGQPKGTAPQKKPTQNTKPSRGGKVNRVVPPVEIRTVAFRPDDPKRVHLEIATSGKATPYVRYQPETGQLVMDVPNALLRLSDENQVEQTFTHPLVRGLHVAMAQETPPVARITVDMERVVGFVARAEENRIALELRVPRNATGALADKLIVVDAGHGGTSSGAQAGGFKEKDITLAISLKLRAILESCGARVVMTRDSDTNVDLYDRPKLANEVGADLFVSIHNDSTRHPNSASGTTTYYHQGDPNSRALAVCVQQAIKSVSNLPSRGALSDSVLYASGLAVLRVSQMPAILVEVAYINNDRDRSRLIDPVFQKKVAQAIATGLRCYVEGLPMTAPPDKAEGLETEPAEPPMEETNDRDTKEENQDPPTE